VSVNDYNKEFQRFGGKKPTTKTKTNSDGPQCIGSTVLNPLLPRYSGTEVLVGTCFSHASQQAGG
jgi:hypothetical protein